jgi:hypothetical protein
VIVATLWLNVRKGQGTKTPSPLVGDGWGEEALAVPLQPVTTYRGRACHSWARFGS